MTQASMSRGRIAPLLLSVLGLLAAQVAAKNNHIYVNDGMTSLLTDHVADIRNNYRVDFGNGMVFPEPWPGAWAEYADMISRAVLPPMPLTVIIISNSARSPFVGKPYNSCVSSRMISVQYSLHISPLTADC